MFVIPGTSPHDQESIAPYLDETPKLQPIETAAYFAVSTPEVQSNSRTMPAQIVERPLEKAASPEAPSAEELRLIVQNSAAWVAYARQSKLDSELGIAA